MSDMIGKQCVLYCRIGGVAPMDKSALDSQWWTLHCFAEKQGFNVVAAIKELESGVLPNRPSITELIGICEEHHTRFLFVESLGRLCRLPIPCKGILHRLYLVGVEQVITRKEGTLYLDAIFG